MIDLHHACIILYKNSDVLDWIMYSIMFSIMVINTTMACMGQWFGKCLGQQNV